MPDPEKLWGTQENSKQATAVHCARIPMSVSRKRTVGGSSRIRGSQCCDPRVSNWNATIFWIVFFSISSTFVFGSS